MNRRDKKALDAVALKMQEGICRESKQKENIRHLKASAYLENLESINEHFGTNYATCCLIKFEYWDAERIKPYLKKDFD
jgi:hypothetical protein